jgi:hypothetical protein
MILGVDDPVTLQKRIARGTDKRAIGEIRKINVTDTFAAIAPPVKGNSVVLYNQSGKAIAVRRGASGESLNLPDGTGIEVDLIDNTGEVQIKNATDAVAVDVKYVINGEVFN